MLTIPPYSESLLIMFVFHHPRFLTGLLWGLLLISASVQASEVDQFTGRDHPLRDARPLINRVTNETLQQALSQANAAGQCAPTQLYTALRQVFGLQAHSPVIQLILTDPRLERRNFNEQTWIYRDLSPWTAPIILWRRLLPETSRWTVVRFGATELGSDKFEHLFYSGYQYFERYHRHPFLLRFILKFGGMTERYIFGAGSTGIFSYGDLAANFIGLRWWNAILQEEADLLGAASNPGPYVACQNKRWVQVKTMDLSDFIDDTLDEAVNCNKFRDTDTKNKVERHIHELNPTYQCPIHSAVFKNLQRKYGPYAPWILNSDGHRTIIESPYHPTTP